MWTDASGFDAFGGYMEGIFWTEPEPLTTAQRLTPEMLSRSQEYPELSLCMGYLELVALYYMVLTPERRLRNCHRRDPWRSRPGPSRSRSTTPPTASSPPSGTTAPRMRL